jgi:hypothetical protein
MSTGVLGLRDILGMRINFRDRWCIINIVVVETLCGQIGIMHLLFGRGLSMLLRL